MKIWSRVEIARWFLDEKVLRGNPWCIKQGCDGFMLERDGYDYIYVWVESYVDHDLDIYFLLDVRTNQDRIGEKRNYLFIASGINGFECEWHDQEIPFNSDVKIHQDRFQEAMKWFAGKILIRYI